jgi:hypothetical protein
LDAAARSALLPLLARSGLPASCLLLLLLLLRPDAGAMLQDALMAAILAAGREGSERT